MNLLKPSNTHIVPKRASSTLIGLLLILSIAMNAHAFPSTPGNGKLLWRVPDVYQLLDDVDEAWIEAQSSITFEVKILALGPNGISSLIFTNAPANIALSQITYSRDYTPICYYLSPRALYRGSEFSVFCDPKLTVNIKAPDAIKGYVDTTPQDFTARGADPNSVAIVNGARNEIKGKTTTQDPHLTSNFSMKFSSGVAKLVGQMNVCLPDGLDCYQVRTLPRIDSINHDQGYTSGGQTLIINGYGFDQGLASVKIQTDGANTVDCVIQGVVTKVKITCLTQSVTAPTVPGTYVGGPGIIRRIYQGYGIQPDYPNFLSYLASPTAYPTITKTDEQVYTTIENPQSIGDYYLTQYQGLFVPKVSGNYRFFIACDDKARIIMGSDKTKVAATATTIKATLDGATGYRNYRSTVGVSAPQALVQGIPYYIEVQHVEGGGGDHVSIGMEIQLPAGNTVPSTHPQATKEVQQLLINQTQRFDIISWNITFATVPAPQLNYTMIFVNQDRTGTILQSGLANYEFNVTASAAQICSQIQVPVYQQALSSDAVCTVTRLTATGAITTVWASTKKVVVTVRSTRFLSKPAISNLVPNPAKVASANTNADIKTQPSSKEDHDLSGPLNGYFTVQCYQQTTGNTKQTTAPIAATASAASVQAAIIKACPNLLDRLTVSEGSTYGGIIQNGRDLILRFDQSYDFPLFQIGNCADPNQYPPITSGGDSTLPITFIPSTVIPFSSTSLFYDQIPVEFLQTYQTTPQVRVNVGQLEAVCAPGSCSYTYVEPPVNCIRDALDPQTSFELACTSTGSSGGSLPADCEGAVASSLCTSTTVAGTIIYHCTLDQPISTGVSFIELVCPGGVIPITSGAEVTLYITVTDISPDAVNRIGGQVVTITGDNFPTTLDGHTVTVEYGGVFCEVFAITSTQIQCNSVLLPLSVPTGSNQIVTVCIDTLCANNLDVDILAPPNVATGFWPNPVSPVLRTNMFFRFQHPFDSTFNTADYQIRYHSISDPSYIRKAALKGLDTNTLDTWKLRFLGAYAGEYRVEIRHVTLGLVDTSALPHVDVNSYIRAISKTTGSVNGGTQITIQGGPFSDNGLENNVMIGDANCVVTFSSNATIECTVSLLFPPKANALKEELFVFLKAAEYAVCKLTDCLFTWSDSDPSTISSFVIANVGGQLQATVTGTFPQFSGSGPFAPPKLYVDSFLQQSLSVSETTLVFKIVRIINLKTKDVVLTIDGGNPGNLPALQSASSTPPQNEYHGLNINVGSTGGSLVTATVTGLDPGMDLSLAGNNIKLYLANGNELCHDYQVIEINKLQCTVGQGSVVQQQTKIVYNGVTLPCADTDTSVCSYRTSSSFPFVQSTAISADKFELILTGGQYLLPATTWKPTCIYAQVRATTITISGTQVRCFFKYGVPFANSDQVPELYFTSTDTSAPSVAHWAVVPVTASFFNQFDASGLTTVGNVKCSPAGECLLVIVNQGNPGLTSSLRNLNVTITVCDNVCEFRQDLSNATHTVCVLHGVPTDPVDDSPSLDHQKKKEKSCNGKKNGQSKCEQKEKSIESKKGGAKDCFSDNRDVSDKKADLKDNSNKNNFSKQSKKLRILSGNGNSNQNQGSDSQDRHNKKCKEITKEQRKKKVFVYNGNEKGWTDSAGKCFLGQKFKKGVIAVISEVQFFIPCNNFNANLYIGVSFQGSMNGVDWTTIVVINIHHLQHSWNSITFREQRFNQYRFLGTNTAGSCTFGKVKLIGYQITRKTVRDPKCGCDVPDPTPNPGPLDCPIVIDFADGTPPVIIDGSSSGNPGYDPALRSYCTSISPCYGSVYGGDVITITGVNFSPLEADTTVLFDSVHCTVITSTPTEITCQTGPRPGLWDAPQTYIEIVGHGKVDCGETFTYVYKWSDENTWGGDGLPEENESVWVPQGLVLLVDIPHSPLLKEVIVEGGLIFDDKFQPCIPGDPNTFDAFWIFANRGYIRIGGDACPYLCDLVITLHGDRLTPEVPLFGNSVIGARYGTIDIHGQKRTPTWIDLETTAPAGSSSIALNGPVDWKVGEQIVLASTSYELDEAEVRMIDAVGGTAAKPVLTLDAPLAYAHYAGIESCVDPSNVELRGEVGLLTRNIVIQGDIESEEDENGGVISAYSVGDETSTIRLEYIEFRRMGQAYKLGRYAIHLRVVGTMAASYVRGCSLYKSYNRFIALHSNSLLVEWNVGYEIKGHAIFQETGTETGNRVLSNLMINTRISWSLQNTDQTPSGYFIQNPANTYTNNRAAGSEGHGFWFNLPANPAGIDYNPGVCPNGVALKEFENNAAHTVYRDGLKHIGTYNPRLHPCQALNYAAGATYNPSVPALFNKFRSWRNRGDGATFDRVGDVKLTNYVASDNLISGIEFSLTDITPDGTAMVENATVVGRSAGNSADVRQLNNKNAWGVVTARSENFWVRDVNFCQYNGEGYAALKSCSNCDQVWTLTDSGARTVTFEKLSFDDATVPRRIAYTWPYRDIFYDLDGTLTGLTPNSWATPYWKHNDQPECSISSVKYNGLICDNRVEVRRIVFFNYLPSYFDWADLKVLRYDLHQTENGVSTTNDYSANAVPSPLIDYINYDARPANYSVIPFKQYTLPNNAWAIPFVTGKTYKIHWRTGLDFQRLTFELSQRWKVADSQITLVLNTTETRETIAVNITSVSPAQKIARDSLIGVPKSDWLTGDNRLYNQTAIRQLHVIANGRNMTRRQVTLFGYNCLLYCPTIDYSIYGPNGEPPCPGYKYWSKPSSWDDNIVPIAGQNVLIRRNCIYIYDVPSSPILGSVVVEGKVIWDVQDSLVMNTKFLFIRGGFVIIGNSTTDYFKGSRAEIMLHGTQSEQYLAYSTWIEAGGKVLAVAGSLTMYGITRERRTRLTVAGFVGDTNLYVGENLGWQAGELVAFAATGTDWRAGEHATIVTYDGTTGNLVIASPLKHYHFGASQAVNDASYNVDIRGEVYLLTSNVKVTGADTDFWGGAIVVSDYKENNGKARNGTLYMDNVEVNNCSQYDTFKAALRFESSGIVRSEVTNSVFRNGLGKGLQVLKARNVLLRNNIFFDFRQWGGNVQASKDIELDRNVFFHIGVRYTAAGKKIPPNGGLLVCAYEQNDKCTNLRVTDNIVSGAAYAGFGAPGGDCTNDMKNKDGAWFVGNIAHSNNGSGAIFFPDPSKSSQVDCFQAQQFTAYKNRGYGAISYSESKKIQFVGMTLIDNFINAGLMSGYGNQTDETEQRQLIYADVKFYGDSPISKDCLAEDACKLAGGVCEDRSAVALSVFTQKANIYFPRDNTLYDEIYSDAIWNGLALYKDVQFLDYLKTKTFCGAKQSLFSTNQNATDHYAIQRFEGTKLYRVNEKVFGGLWKDPNPEWAVVEKCGNFPCSGPKNIILKFSGTDQSAANGNEFYDANNVVNTPTFYIISNNEIGLAMGCRYVADWNGYYCDKPDGNEIAHLQFESLDSDKFTRTFSPINITSATLPTFKNVLNSFSDKGFTLYGGQLRRTRFATTVKTGSGYGFNVSYTGTVPKEQRFRLDANENNGVIVTIQYTEQNSYSVSVGGTVIDYNAWDTTNRIMKAVSPTGLCGENRYIAVKNVLQFMIKQGCAITIKPRDVIMASVRLEWTVDEFYSDGGTTLFIDRISAVLGIHPSTVKIVTVYTGSVIIKYDIVNPVTENKQVLTQIKAKLDAVMKVGATFLGAPILDFDASFPVPQEDAYTPEAPKATNTSKPIVISQNLTVTEDTTAPVMTKQQVAKLVIIVGSVLGVCVAVSIVVWCICRKRKGDVIAIHVQQKGDTTTKQGINISQEYDTQYHPKSEIGKVFDFDELDKKKKAKVNEDNVDDAEETEQEKPKSDEEDWRQDWNTDTVRTNANRYTDENYLMNSPQARNDIGYNFDESNRGSVVVNEDAAPTTAKTQQEKSESSEIYIETE